MRHQNRARTVAADHLSLSVSSCFRCLRRNKLPCGVCGRWLFLWHTSSSFSSRCINVCRFWMVYITPHPPLMPVAVIESCSDNLVLRFDLPCVRIYRHQVNGIAIVFRLYIVLDFISHFSLSLLCPPPHSPSPVIPVAFAPKSIRCTHIVQ